MAGVTSPVPAVVIDHTAERMIVNHRDDRLYSAPPDDMAAVITGADAVLGDMRWPAGATAALAGAAAAGVPGVL